MSEVDFSNLDLSIKAESTPVAQQQNADTPENAVSQQDFLAVVAEIIGKANHISQDKRPEMVSSALLYAASRFNAYIVASSSKDKETFIAERDKALAFFTEQYDAMFKENMADYTQNFENFLGRNQ